MKYLFICAIGPVQEFIATARRSRDLWYGSWMLSELSKAAAREIAGLSSQPLIFPAPVNPQQLNPDSDLTVPNRIVAIMEGDTRMVVEQVRVAVMKRLNELRDDAFAQIKGKFNAMLAKEQVDDLPEVYWVSVPFENDYSLARNEAEALMAARKVTRDFKPMMGTDASKSSLDGARESVVLKTEYPERNDPVIVKDKKIQNLYKHYHAHQGEQLSGVDLLKRLGGEKLVQKFRSTSHMAALPFLERIDREKGEGKGQELLIKIQYLLTKDGWDIGEVDGGLVFESRLTDWIPAEAVSENLCKQFVEILKDYAGDSKPNPYYALLAADGDNMGVFIDAQRDPEKHRKLSQALSQFALEAPNIIEKHQGVPIYSGGDDVLTYLPLHTALICAAELEQKFKTILKDFMATDQNGNKIVPTLSTGIVIAHHLEPLSDVLELAREAERQAKQEKGKNGLAITLSKRGGADRTVSGKWGVFDQRLNRLIDFTQKNEISAGTAYELQELHRILNKAEVPRAGLVGEALRIVARKHKAGGGEKVKDEVENAFKEWLEQIDLSVDELAKEMIVGRMLAGEMEEDAAAPAEKEVAA